MEKGEMKRKKGIIWVEVVKQVNCNGDIMNVMLVDLEFYDFF